MRELQKQGEWTRWTKGVKRQKENVVKLNVAERDKVPIKRARTN